MCKSPTIERPYRRVFLLIACLALAAAGALRTIRTEAVSAHLQFETVAQFGGNCRAVDVEGAFVYISEGPALKILDVSQPETAEPVGRVLIGEMVNDLTVSGDRVYLIAGEDRFVSVDVSDRTAPQVVGETDLPGKARAMAESGGFGYLAAHDGGLFIVTVHDPRRPRVVSLYNTDGYSYGLWISGDRLYLANGPDGFEILDISDPISPVRISSYVPPSNRYYQPPADVWNLRVAGTTAYVANSNDFLVVDIADLSSPTTLARLPMRFAHYVELAGTTAYVFGGVTFRTIDVSDPAHPAETGVFLVPEIGDDLCLDNGFAYIADWSSLEVFDVRSPGSEMLFGRHTLPGDARSVTVSSGTTYVANSADGLRILNTSIPSMPELLGSSNIESRVARNIFLDGDLAYMNAHSDGLFVFDVANPTSPVLLANYPTTQPIEDIHVAGDYAYASIGHALAVLDVSDPTSPAEVGRYKGPVGGPMGIDVAGTLVYAAGTSFGLAVIDVADPTSPVLHGFYPFGEANPRDVAVRDERAYVVAETEGLVVLDMSDPSSPVLVGHYDTPGYAWGISLENDVAYIADLSSVQMIDVSAPESPVLLGAFQTPAGAESVAAVDGLIYVADYESGLWVFSPVERAGIKAKRWKRY